MRHGTRRGYTLLELLVVLAVLIVLGFLLMPTIDGLAGNTKIDAGADLVRGYLANARALAVEQGQPVRVALSADGTRVRLGPDTAEFGTLQPGQSSNTQVNPPQAVAEDSLPDTVTAHLITEEGQPPPAGDGNWTTIATFLPGGTCKEVRATVELNDPNSRPIQIRVRGLNGAVDSVTVGGQQP